MAAGSQLDRRTNVRKERPDLRQGKGLTDAFTVRRVSWNVLLRSAAVLGQATTILLTRQLWNVRQYDRFASLTHLAPPTPPLLPALNWLPQFPIGELLVASLLVVMFRPRIGVALHAALLTLAMLMDQTRIQPECVSFVLLMVGSLESPGAKLIGRSHLIAMWFFAGFHKLFCAGYYAGVMHFLLTPLSNSFPSPLCHFPPAVYYAIGAPCALFEMALGVMAIVPRTRRIAAVLGAAMHAILFLWLSLAVHWNSAVWSWNLALIVAGFALLWNWKSTLIADWRSVSFAGRAAALFLLLSPIGYYFRTDRRVSGPLCLFEQRAGGLDRRAQHRSAGPSVRQRFGVGSERFSAAGAAALCAIL